MEIITPALFNSENPVHCLRLLLAVVMKVNLNVFSLCASWDERPSKNGLISLRQKNPGIRLIRFLNQMDLGHGRLMNLWSFLKSAQTCQLLVPMEIFQTVVDRIEAFWIRIRSYLPRRQSKFHHEVANRKQLHNLQHKMFWNHVVIRLRTIKLSRFQVTKRLNYLRRCHMTANKRIQVCDNVFKINKFFFCPAAPDLVAMHDLSVSSTPSTFVESRHYSEKSKRMFYILGPIIAVNKFCFVSVYTLLKFAFGWYN